MKHWILVLLIFFLGCRTTSFYQKEYREVSKSYNNWVYKELKNKQDIRVLLFNKKVRIDLLSYPNFIIGINKQGDTIAVIDKDYENNLILNDKVVVEQCIWNPNEKEMIKPLLTISKNRKINQLYLSIDTVFYGSIVE